MPGLPQVTLQLLCYPTGKLAHAPLGAYALPHNTHLAVSLLVRLCKVNSEAGNSNYFGLEYIRDKSVQLSILACITTFFENDIVKRHAWTW